MVKLSDSNTHKIDVDSDIFDDPYIEAATRAVEICKVNNTGTINHFTECWEPKNVIKSHIINSYWVLVNASMFETAEALREKYKSFKNVDLFKEPIHGNIR